MKNRTSRINPSRNTVKMFQNRFTLESIVLPIQGLKKLSYPSSLLLTFYLLSNFEPEIKIFFEQPETEIKIELLIKNVSPKR